MRDFAFVRDESTTLGGLIAMPQPPVISDLMRSIPPLLMCKFANDFVSQIDFHFCLLYVHI